MPDVNRPLHKCPKNGCNEQLKASLLACRKHWFEVSKPTRDAVWRAFRSGTTAEHHAAMQDAIEEMNSADH